MVTNPHRAGWLALIVVLASACGPTTRTLETSPTPGATATTTVAGPLTEPTRSTATPGRPPASATPTVLPAVALLAVAEDDGTARRLVTQVLDVRPHDSTAFTQGLEFDGARLYESRGRLNESALTEIAPGTGAVLRSTPLADDLFGEGLAIVGERAIQLTWKAGKALVYDIETFELIDTYPYEGEGWGLCFDGTSLVMSNGSSQLTYRDPTTFEAVRSLEVTLDGAPIDRLNELECVGDLVVANVWRTNTLVAIDPDGRVASLIDATALAQYVVSAPGTDVLNGVAFDPTSQTFLLTGKYWPAMFEVTFEVVG